MPKEYPKVLTHEQALSLVKKAEQDAEYWAGVLDGRSRPRSNFAITPEQRALFLAVLARTGVVTHACRASNLSSAAAYSHRRLEPDFKAAWDEARDTALDVLRMEAFRRGVEGYERPIYQRGEKVGTEIVYSDRLLEVLLQKAPEHRPRGLLELAPGSSGELTFRWESGPPPDAEPDAIEAESHTPVPDGHAADDS